MWMLKLQKFIENVPNATFTLISGAEHQSFLYGRFRADLNPFKTAAEHNSTIRASILEFLSTTLSLVRPIVRARVSALVFSAGSRSRSRSPRVWVVTKRNEMRLVDLKPEKPGPEIRTNARLLRVEELRAGTETSMVYLKSGPAT